MDETSRHAIHEHSRRGIIAGHRAAPAFESGKRHGALELVAGCLPFVGESLLDTAIKHGLIGRLVELLHNAAVAHDLVVAPNSTVAHELHGDSGLVSLYTARCCFEAVGENKSSAIPTKVLRSFARIFGAPLIHLQPEN